LDTRSVLQVTPEEREIAKRVNSAIMNARAKLQLEKEEAALAAKPSGKREKSSAADKKAVAAAAEAAADSGRGSPSPRTSSAASASPSARGRKAAAGGSPAAAAPLFEPDPDLSDYLLGHSFFDLYRAFTSSRGGEPVLSESDLIEVLYRYLLIQGGRTFAQGVVIDGLDSSFTQGEQARAARVVKAAFERLGNAASAEQSPHRCSGRSSFRGFRSSSCVSSGLPIPG
jgi:hypothetical protein